VFDGSTGGNYTWEDRVFVGSYDYKLYCLTAKDGKTSTALFKLDNDHSIRWMLGESRSVVLRRDR